MLLKRVDIFTSGVIVTSQIVASDTGHILNKV